MKAPSLNFSAGGIIAGGLAGAAGAAADHYGRVEANQEHDRRMEVLMQKEKQLAKYNSQVEIEKKQTMLDMEDARQKAKSQEVAGMLQSERDKSNGVGGPGGYDPKAYDNLDEEGKAEFDLQTMVKTGNADPLAVIKYKLDRGDKLAKAEQAAALAELKYELDKRVREGQMSLRESEFKLREAELMLKAEKAAQGPAPSDLEKAAAAQARIGTKNERPEDKALVELYKKDKVPYDTVTDTTEATDDYGNTTRRSTARKVPAGKPAASSGGKPWERFAK